MRRALVVLSAAVAVVTLAVTGAIVGASTGNGGAFASVAQAATMANAGGEASGISRAQHKQNGSFVPKTFGDFEPGFIVSDYNFYNSDAMSEAEIQEFLESQKCVPRDGVSCLADYRQTTTSQPAEGGQHCAPYRGARAEPASRILAKVSEACGISPRALLVLLQKEQSLLTGPSEYGYQRAMGYACPDTADCDSEYFGFFNQVYNAAWQMRQYTEQPNRQYKIGVVPVQYHPNAACGASEVRIVNQATANLYNYTPYQPNLAATGDLAGEGDECSTHGNLNFWLLYSKWFGDPQTVPYEPFFGACASLVGGHGCTIPRFPLAPLDPLATLRLAGLTS